MAASENEPWQLRLYGRFSVVAPDGQAVRLPDRKTEGLLAILALNRKFGIMRRSAANILWPGREPQNLANLRQAIAVLRRILGPESIEGSAGHCRLSSGFSLVSDHENPSLRGDGGFMPGHEGEWFEDVRLESIEGHDAELSAVGHYLDTLRSLASYDPRSMYAILGATPAMARSLPYLELGCLLENAKGLNSPPGWHAFWLGTVKNDLVECIELLRSALRRARDERDLSLASEVCFELGRAYSRTGEYEKATKICDFADEIAARSRTKDARKNALRLRGTVLFQWRDPESGCATLLRLEEELDNPTELASLVHLRAFLEASAGWFERAQATHDLALHIARESGHFRTGIVSATTSAILDAASGRHADALRQLEALSATFYAQGATQFGVYTEELMAKLNLLEGDKVAANRLSESANRQRVRSRMATTPLEARLLASLR
ncbi:MAG TPA: hypothetical protein VG820_04715 [Fimbriimonadaceae bacterium]|nr:hypothetical protein [Fimbriimonadaceae bacterium]